MAAADTAVLSPEREMESDLTHLMSLVETSRIEEARLLVLELARKWPESAPIKHMRRVLEPPTVFSTPVPRGRALNRERAWIRANALDYPGCWLAVHGDTLVASDPDGAEVIRKVRHAGLSNAVLIYFQPAPDR